MKNSDTGARRSDETAARAGWMARVFGGALGDVRFAARLLWKSKGFATATLVTLALCIGANSAIFSMLYSLVLKPLPFREPGRIVDIYNLFSKISPNKSPSNIVQYLDFKQNTDVFAAIGLWHVDESTLGEESGPVRVSGVAMTADMFDVLGIRPIVGRFFTAENSVPGAERVVVLTQSFWESHFQERPEVIGGNVRIDGETFSIIGVAPRMFDALDARAKFVRPMAWAPDRVAQRARYGVSPRLYARLKPGATVAQAFAQVDALERRFYDGAPAATREFLERSGHVIGVETVQAQRTAPVKSALFLLQGLVLLVLLIGCVNVANLLLARSNARQSELAVRTALGASRGVLARQLIIESLLLTFLGGVLGLGFAWVEIHAINPFTAQMLPSALPFAIDGRVLGYTAATAAAMGVFIGLIPVLHIFGTNLLALLQGQSRSASGGRRVRAMSTVLVIAQMAIALVLLTSAGLLVRSFANALSVDPGFDPRGVVAARVALPADYRREDRVLRFQEQLLASLQEVPGFTKVSLATATPFQTQLPANAFTLRDYALPPDAPQPGARHLGASPSYLETLRIPLREGRWFDATDTEKSRKVYVVDEDFAKRYFEGRSALGQSFTFGSPPQKPEDWPVIIGVVGNVKHRGVEEKADMPFIYYPLQQIRAGGISVFVRSERPVSEVIALIREKVHAIDPALPLFQTGSMGDVIGDSFSRRRAIMLLTGVFAGIALLLSAVGIYGVLAYDVSQRTREIGIRGAIGATRGQVVGLILRQGLWKSGIGVVLGLIGAFFLSRLMTDFLFEVKPTDPVAYVVVALLLLVVALVASYLPARRAARIDPLEALRSE